MYLYQDKMRFLIVPVKKEIEGFEFVQEISQVFLDNSVECNAYVCNAQGSLDTFLIE